MPLHDPSYNLGFSHAYTGMQHMPIHKDVFNKAEYDAGYAEGLRRATKCPMYQVGKDVALSGGELQAFSTFHTRFTIEHYHRYKLGFNSIRSRLVQGELFCA